MTRGPTARRRQLGRALRKARDDAGLTQSAVGRQLGCGQAKINKIETTLVAVSTDELDKLITIYAIPAEKAAELRELVSQDHADGPRRTNYARAWSAYEQLVDLEQEAREIRCWHSERIPKPLQSEFYMLRQRHPETTTTDDVVRLLRRREARARIFILEDPPLYRAILSESSLLRMPGGISPKVVVDQAEHLLDLIAKHERLKLQILTFQADIRFVNTDFQIMHFTGDEPDFAYVESPGGSRRFDKPDELKNFEEHWDVLHAAALSPEESVHWLRELVIHSKEEWKKQENN